MTRKKNGVLWKWSTSQEHTQELLGAEGRILVTKEYSHVLGTHIAMSDVRSLVHVIALHIH